MMIDDNYLLFYNLIINIIRIRTTNNNVKNDYFICKANQLSVIVPSSSSYTCYGILV